MSIQYSDLFLFFPGNETWSRGFGKADIINNIDVDTTTLFNIGSVTKSFTMNLLAILLTEQK